MKKFILFLILFMSIGFVYGQNEIVFRKAGSITLVGTTVDSIMVPIFDPDEWSNSLRAKSATMMTIPARTGTWGLYIYSNVVSVSTNGNVDITYRKVDWNYVTEDATETSLTSAWAWSHLGFKIFNVTQSVPVPFIWVIVERTSGDGTARFDIWTAYK